MRYQPKPTTSEIRAHIRASGKLDARAVHVISDTANHLMYGVIISEDEHLALRMVNPESYRRSEWISAAEEFELLHALVGSGLAPTPVYLDETFRIPFLVQEFVKATCFNELKPLSNELIGKAALAIAKLNTRASRLAPHATPWMRSYEKQGFGSGVEKYVRLADAVRRNPRHDVISWAVRIGKLLREVQQRLARASPLLDGQLPSFHFDGAHAGNTYLRDGQVMFLDWEKVSWRDDPSFTLVRFATSAGKEKGKTSPEIFEALIAAYVKVHPVAYFEELARTRLLERQAANTVWVLWDYTRRNDKRRVAEATSVEAHFTELERILGEQ